MCYLLFSYFFYSIYTINLDKSACFDSNAALALLSPFFFAHIVVLGLAVRFISQRTTYISLWSVHQSSI